jgi:hypothetical protein
MEKYIGAFRAGISAATQVHEAQREVDQVLREFYNALERATGGRLYGALSESQNLSAAIDEAKMAVTMQAHPRGKRLSLVAVDRVSGQRIELAGWRQGKTAYPCWLYIRNQEIACTDRVSLEAELSRLASSQEVGEKILQLLK